MSNSQNKKNEQQNNLCTTLTEQWKKGELEQGYYYTTVEDYNGVSRNIANYYNKDICFHHILVKEVLAPVPSYEEWQHQQMSLRMTIDDYKNVVDICEQLKELLKECKEQIYLYKDMCHQDGYFIKEPFLDDLMTKIDNAIGEK